MPAVPATQGRPEHGGLPLPASPGVGGFAFHPAGPWGKGARCRGKPGGRKLSLAWEGDTSRSRPRTAARLPTEDPGEGRRGFREQQDSWRPLTGLLSLPDSGPQSPLSLRPARGCVLPLGGAASAGHPFWASRVVGALVPCSCFQSQRMQNVSPVGRETREDRCTLRGPCAQASRGTRELPRGGNGQYSPILKVSALGGDKVGPQSSSPHLPKTRRGAGMAGPALPTQEGRQ